MAKVTVESLKLENKKLNESIETLEKHVERLELKVKQLESEKVEFFSVKENKELYSNYKQMETLSQQLEHYKRLFENKDTQYKQQINTKSELVEALKEVIPEDNFKSMDELKDTIKTLRPVKKNERNAGRKPKCKDYIEKVKELIKLHPELSTREIAIKIGISHTTVARIIKQTSK